MAEFYVEKTAKETGEHVVHSKTCPSLPAEDKMMYIGAFSNANAPVNYVTGWYSKVTVCPDCIAS